jgi:Mycothiol maleylpyruvate isomerase N-terminal domain
MDTTPRIELWLTALHASSERLAKTVDGLSDDALSVPSFAIGWSIAQVLSHLGSGAEIITILLRRGIDGNTAGPSTQDTQPVWQG